VAVFYSVYLFTLSDFWFSRQWAWSVMLFWVVTLCSAETAQLATCSHQFFAWLTFWPRRRRWYIPLKRWVVSKLHSVTNQKTICLIYSHELHSCDIQPKSNKHPLPHSAKFNFSPPKETIISFICNIRFHSLEYKNAFLLWFIFHIFTLKLHYFRKIVRK
jgi:hypothetical protein